MSKKAVIVGLSYKNDPGRVKTEGCITSTKHFRNILVYYFRFPPENVTYISDEDRETTPTDRYRNGRVRLITGMVFIYFTLCLNLYVSTN
jgi:hypothetical protein